MTSTMDQERAIDEITFTLNYRINKFWTVGLKNPQQQPGYQQAWKFNP